MKQAKILSSKVVFNSIVTVVITQINQRQTFGDGTGWKHYSKLKHYELLTSGHFLRLHNRSHPFSAYYLSVGTAQCDTEPQNICTVIRSIKHEGPHSCAHTLWPLSALGEEADHWRETDTERQTCFANPRLCSPALWISSAWYNAFLQSRFPRSGSLVNWSTWERWTD